MLSAEIMDFFGICVVTTAVLGFAGWIIAMLRRSPFTPAQSVLYALNYALSRILWRVQIHGDFPIPLGQGALIVCNHRCPLDPSFIALTTPRVIHWMVAREYCEHPAFRKLLSLCEVIPVRRGAVDMAAIRKAIDLLQRGEIVGLFPEGHINTTAELLLPGRTGAALIAMKARTPVVPCYIHGAPYNGTTLGCLLMPARVRLMIGRPIELTTVDASENDRRTLDDLTRRFLGAIARLAGRSDFEPRVIGRRRDQRNHHVLSEEEPPS